MNKLLIIADIEDTCAAIPRGLALAKEMDLQPEVLAFTWADIRRLKVDSATAAKIKKQLLDERKTTIAKRIAKYAGDESPIKYQVVWSEDIHTSILKRVTSDYVALVKSRHPSKSLGHTPTDWHLLRECPVPVLLVGKKKWQKSATIMASVDLDTASVAKQKLNVAVILEARHYAEIFNADLLVLCVIDVPVVLTELGLIDAKSYANKRRAELGPKLAALAATTGLSPDIFKLKRGPVAKTIVSEAHALKPQLLVMGTVGRKGIKAKLLGNTAESVLQLLNSDTLTLKP